jgi:hypothetical protein
LETLNGTVANGRKLGFITQEMGAKLIPWDLNQSCTNAEVSRSNERRIRKD